MSLPLYWEDQDQGLCQLPAVQQLLTQVRDSSTALSVDAEQAERPRPTELNYPQKIPNTRRWVGWE
jgi:hypothetical protein